MKKLLILSLFFISCKDNSKVTITQQEYDKLRGVKQVVPEYPKEIKVYDNWNNPTVPIIKVDNCEYIAYCVGTNGGFLAHKGNCKFCQQRLEETIRRIIQEEMKKLIIGLLLCSNFAICQTQYDLTMEAEYDFIKARSKLDSVYVAISLKHDTCFATQMVKAASAWDIYSKAQVEAKYADCTLKGSSVIMCKYFYLTYLISRRIEELTEEFLKPGEEGDICK